VCVDLRATKRIGSRHPLSHPSHASFSYAEAHLAVKSTSGEIAILTVPEGSVVASKAVDAPDEGACVHFSACDKYVVDASWSGSVRVRHSGTLIDAAKFAFPGEMITVVSPSADRMTWLFAHQPRAQSEVRRAPYLTLWRWPLQRPAATIPSRLDNLHSAALSPCGSRIALIGYRRGSDQTVVSMMTLDGQVVREAQTSLGGTGSNTRWSADGKLVGTVQADGFAVFRTDDLSLYARLPARFPSDIAFIGSKRLAIGTWSGGSIAELPAAMRTT